MLELITKEHKLGQLKEDAGSGSVYEDADFGSVPDEQAPGATAVCTPAPTPAPAEDLNAALAESVNTTPNNDDAVPSSALDITDNIDTPARSVLTKMVETAKKYAILDKKKVPRYVCVHPKKQGENSVNAKSENTFTVKK